MKLMGKAIGTIALSAAMLGSVAVVAAVATADSAYAGNGNGKGNGNGNSGERGRSGEKNSNAGGNGRGEIASELKGANASKANAKAFENAADGSQIGRLRGYRDAAIETQGAYDAWQAAYNEYLAFEGTYEGPSSAELIGAIDELDPGSEAYEDDLAALEEQLEEAQAYENERDRLAEASNDAQSVYEAQTSLEEAALLAATGGRTLSEAALAELRARLGL